MLSCRDAAAVRFYISTYRPIPVDEYLVYENGIYPAATSRQLFQTGRRFNDSVRRNAVL
jgi:hypothetical protein